MALKNKGPMSIEHKTTITAVALAMQDFAQKLDNAGTYAEVEEIMENFETILDDLGNKAEELFEEED